MFDKTAKALTHTFICYSVAPFNAMKNRALADTTGNPGPGSYAAEKTKIVATVKDMMSNSFSTKVSSSIF